MNKKVIAIIAVIVPIAFILWKGGPTKYFWQSKTLSEHLDSTAEIADMSSEELAEAVDANEPPADPDAVNADDAPKKAMTPKISKKKKKSAEIPNFREILKYPSLEDVDSDLEEAQHDTAPVMIEFAKSVAPHMAKALKNERYARAFFKELESCADNTTVEILPIPARSLCVANAKRLARKHKKFEKKFEALLNRMPPRIQTIHKASNL